MKQGKSKNREIIRIFLLVIIFALTCKYNISNATDISEEFEKGIAQNNYYNDVELKENSLVPLTYTIVPDNQEDNTVFPKFNSKFFSRAIDGLLGTGLPTSYNTLEYLKNNKGIDISIKNQQGSSSCWAFSTASMLEMYNSIKQNNQSSQYSTMHMDFGCSNNINGVLDLQRFNRYVGTGGNYQLAMAYLTNGLGGMEKSTNITTENNMEEDEFYERYNLSEKANYKMNANQFNGSIDVKVDDYTEFPDIKKEKNGDEITYYYNNPYGEQVEYNQSTLKSVRDTIKEHIKEYGALTACTYASNSTTERQKYFSDDYNSYYCDDQSKTPDHAVTIIGWDDNYPVSNFKKQPANPGAYIVLNSWGDSWGNEGYYYISYDDVNIETMLMGITNVSEKDYDNLYQYDELGKNIFRIGSETEPNYIYFANVFDRNNSADIEKLDNVSVSLDRTCDVEVYVNTNIGDSLDSEDWENLRKVEVEEGTFGAGYHTIHLKDNIYLTQDKFIVAIKTTAVNSNSVGLALECKPEGLSENLYQLGWYNYLQANNNESFVSFDGNLYMDVNYVLKGSSTCIKAFTTNVEDSEINVGDTYELDETKMYIYDIPTETTETEFKNELDQNGNIGYTISDTVEGLIVTGTKINASNGITYTAIVTGDITGDGKLNGRDLARVKKYYIGRYELSDKFVYAADIDQNGTISGKDLAKMKKQYLGLD